MSCNGRVPHVLLLKNLESDVKQKARVLFGGLHFCSKLPQSFFPIILTSFFCFTVYEVLINYILASFSFDSFPCFHTSWCLFDAIFAQTPGVWGVVRRKSRASGRRDDFDFEISGFDSSTILARNRARKNGDFVISGFNLIPRLS